MPQMTIKKAKKLLRWGKHDINGAWKHLQNCGRFIDFKERLGPYNDIKNVWKGQPCYVLGGSVAARGLDLGKLKGKNTITCNHMIEKFPDASWFLFMDQRFLRINKFDLKSYDGKLFALNSNPVFYDSYKDLVLFKTKNITEQPADTIEGGLYSRSLSGMCILNLAIISGANPIYMLGLDCPKDIDISKGIHYDQQYTGEGNLQKSHAGVTKLLPYFDRFRPWRARIINVCENGYIDTFKKISLKDFEENHL